MRFKITEKDIHPHLRARMDQRGVTTEEIIQAMNSGELVSDARPGTLGKRLAFPYNKDWEGKLYREKEVTVYYKSKNQEIIILTVVARYGTGFKRRNIKDED
jgi:hypothetical protein